LAVPRRANTPSRSRAVLIVRASAAFALSDNDQAAELFVANDWRLSDWLSFCHRNQRRAVNGIAQ
jgi:hypothetical protein